MSTNKVLITGVAGFIGSNLLDFLIEKTDWEIDGLDNLSTGNMENITHQLSNSRFRFLQQQCSDLKSVKPYDRIFHLAALPRIQPSFVQVNEHITANLCQSVHLLELMIRENYFPRLHAGLDHGHGACLWTCRRRIRIGRVHLGKPPV